MTEQLLRTAIIVGIIGICIHTIDLLLIDIPTFYDAIKIRIQFYKNNKNKS